MVKICLCLLCLGLGWMKGLMAVPLIDASIDSNSAQAHYPLEGIITITHAKTEKIDPHSFEMEQKPLKATLVREISMSAANTSNLWVSIYSFQLPAQNKGLYVLPSLSVKIEGQTYRSLPSTYEVQEVKLPINPSPHLPSSSAKNSTQPPLIFHLEAKVKGPKILYPSQRTKLFYRISYNRNIDLTRSELSLIHPPFFKKVGDVQIRDYQQQNVTIQELTQEIEASELGTFHLGPSLIEGYAYTIKDGQKVYDSTLLQAKAPIVTLEVKSFPQYDQPLSFTGAIGDIKIAAHLKSSSLLAIGETLQLEVQIQGVENLEEVHLPSLQCQPGFSGFFQSSDLPPLAKVKEKTKIFQVELRATSTLATQIPAIRVSSFDPHTQTYVEKHTSPIPLTVYSQAAEKDVLTSQQVLLPPLPPLVRGEWPIPPLPPLELEHQQPVQMNSIDLSWRHTPWVLCLLPIGGLLLLIQALFYRWWQQRPKLQISKSEELLQRALTLLSTSYEGLQLLEQAFWLRLREKHLLTQQVFRLEQLPREGRLGSVRSFLLQLQALQYSPNKSFDLIQLQQQAKQLFTQI